jgi:signal transduction histidine kinase/ActR/RegA family two-component response regulator
MDVAPLVRAGLVSLRQIDPAELSPGEFAHNVREAVENEKTELVVIDSLNGYLNATPSERFLTLHLHELLTYLGQSGATTLLMMTQHGIVGTEMAVPVDASYLADAGLACHVDEDSDSLARAVREGVGAIVLTEEVITRGDNRELARVLANQPSWSEIPIILLVGAGTDSSVTATALALLGNVTILERPVRVTTLVSALRTAVRARRRQYEVRNTLLELTNAHAALHAQSERLRDSDRRKDEFLATLAHELRNPLAPIRNALQIIHLAGNNGPTVEQAHEMMERQLGQMVRLIDDLLDVSRISRGKLELRKERIELDAAIRSAVDTAQPLIDAAGHQLTVSGSPRPIYLDADPVRLAQVFSNLLNNAAKYMERGGRIWLTVTPEEREVVVSVRDTGIGIPGEALPGIFDMFSQVDHSLEKAQGGLGIGLTLVKQLLEMHGGRIEARSEGAGKGSEFIARLPVVAVAPRPQLAETGEQRRSRTPTCRILVADDNRDAAESMSTVLRLMGNEVRTVHDGLQAIEEAAAFRPDLVLLDIGMPRLNGYDAARRIRGERWGKSTLIVAMTGWGQDEDKRRAREAGFDRHFTKPVDPGAIAKLIAEMRSSSAQRTLAPGD